MWRAALFLIVLFTSYSLVHYSFGFLLPRVLWQQRENMMNGKQRSSSLQKEHQVRWRLNAQKERRRKRQKKEINQYELMINSILEASEEQEKNITSVGPIRESDNLIFPELEDAGIDEKKLRQSPFGKVLFGILDVLYPVFREPNWFDLYDPPLSAEQNLDLPYFDGYDFVNSSWTIYVRHRFGWWNWLDRLGFVPQATQRVFFRGDGRTLFTDGFYGSWYINPAINYFQFEKHYARGAGHYQYSKGIRIYQVQRWNFENNIGRYWQRGLRSTLRNETNFFALEGRVWGAAVNWRRYPRDQGKFIAIRDGTNLTEVFGGEDKTPWARRFHHAMSLPFYQAHPDQLERIEDNFDMYYRNMLGEKIR